MEENDPKLRPFYDGEGKLVRIPAKSALKAAVYRALSGLFETGRNYSEKEVNSLICGAIAFGDVERVRRDLIEARLLCRTPDGARYWKEAE